MPKKDAILISNLKIERWFWDEYIFFKTIFLLGQKPPYGSLKN